MGAHPISYPKLYTRSIATTPWRIGIDGFETVPSAPIVINDATWRKPLRWIRGLIISKHWYVIYKWWSTHLRPMRSFKAKQTKIPPMLIALLPILTLKASRVFKDFTNNVPYCEENDWPVDCWKKFAAATIEVRLICFLLNICMNLTFLGCWSMAFCNSSISAATSLSVISAFRMRRSDVSASALRPFDSDHLGDYIQHLDLILAILESFSTSGINHTQHATMVGTMKNK